MSDLFRFAQLQPYTLAGAGAVIGDTTITLKSMTDIDGNALSMSGTFGDIGFGTLQPGNGTLEEQIAFTGLTNNSNGTVTLTGVKSVAFVYPYTQTTGLLKTHAGSAPFIISNTSGFYDKLTSKSDDETITGHWTFTTSPTIPDPTNGTDAANKEYVDGVAIAGAPVANDTTTGIVRIATRAQMAAGSSSTVAYVIESARSSATGGGGTTVAVISQADGTVAPSFFDSSGSYRVNGTTTLAGTTIISGAATISGSTTIAGTTTNSGALVGFYDYQLFTNNGTWTKPSGLAGTEFIKVQLWGAGGGGGSGANKNGGGGGAYLEGTFRASDLTATVSVTIGTTTTAGVNGANSTFGSYMTAYGGGHGNTTNNAGGGGGVTSAGNANTPGNPVPGTSTTDSTFGGGFPGTNANNATNSVHGGGGGGYQAGTVGNSVYGGAGGGGQIAGGTSVFGGGGGTGNGSGNGTDGTAPAGGGGGGSGTGGKGARGEARVWVMK